jgi:hypothetical protein
MACPVAVLVHGIDVLEFRYVYRPGSSRSSLSLHAPGFAYIAFLLAADPGSNAPARCDASFAWPMHRRTCIASP